MQKNTTEAISHLFIVFGLFLICSLLGSLLAMLPLLFIYPNVEIKNLVNIDFLKTMQSGRLIMFYLQAATALGGFILTSWLYVRFIERKQWEIIFRPKPRAGIFFLLTIVLTLTIIPFIDVLIRWNATIHLPEFFKNWESWAIEQEKQTSEIIVFLTDFKGINEVIIGLFVMAVIPAIGEELFFRGLVQRNFAKAINPHLAIWLAGAIFSAIHLQFLGFFPRMLLGVIFGYLYFWSGSLWTAILGHFLNNSIALLSVYFFQEEITNIQGTTHFPTYLVILSLFCTGLILYYYKRVGDGLVVKEKIENIYT